MVASLKPAELAVGGLAAEAEICKRSLREYIPRSWHLFEPGRPFIGGWHVDCICEHLQAVLDGQIKRLLLNVPPRCSKSSICSVAFPTWAWVRKPRLRFLASSYAQELAVRDALKSRRLIQSAWYQRRFSATFKLQRDQNVKSRYENNHLGYRISTSVGAATTGEGGDILLCDDPHSTLEALSEADRLACINWWKEAMSNRHNDSSGASIVIGQRVHSNDLSAELLKQGGWVHVNIPMEYDAKRKCTTSIGWSDPRTVDRELMQPARFSREDLDSRKREMGSVAYAGQYNQNPVPRGGAFFRTDWFSRWERQGIYYRLFSWITPNNPKVVLVSDCLRFITADTAATEKTSGDYTAIGVWDLTPTGDLICLHVHNEQMEAPQVKRTIRNLANIYGAAFVGIEYAATGIAIVQDLRDDGMTIKGLKVTTEIESSLGAKATLADKVARATIAQIRMEGGQIFFPSDSPPWYGPFVAQLLAFSSMMAHDHDDMVDMLSYASIEAHQQKQSGFSGRNAGQIHVPEVFGGVR